MDENGVKTKRWTDALIVEVTLRLALPTGWGFIMSHDEPPCLIVSVHRNGNQDVWVAADLADGGLVSGLLRIYPDDTDEDVLLRGQKLVRNMLREVRKYCRDWN